MSGDGQKEKGKIIGLPAYLGILLQLIEGFSGILVSDHFYEDM